MRFPLGTGLGLGVCGVSVGHGVGEAGMAEGVAVGAPVAVGVVNIADGVSSLRQTARMTSMADTARVAHQTVRKWRAIRRIALLRSTLLLFPCRGSLTLAPPPPCLNHIRS